MTGLALRTSLIWHGEVMDDRVLEKPAPVTIGATGKTTFVTPELGLPAEHAIVSPGMSGYLLTLGKTMRGTVCLDGAIREVADLVGDAEFHATPIGGRDWGVVDLDDTGQYQLFFQFVPRGEPSKRLVTKQMLAVGAAAFAILSIIGTVLWSMKGHDLDEAIFRSTGIATLMLGAALLGRGLLKQDSESQASLVFSLLLHAAILCFTVQIYSNESAQARTMSQPELTGTYFVTRVDEVIQEASKPAAPTPTIVTVNPDPEKPPVALPMPPQHRKWIRPTPQPAAPAAPGPGVEQYGVLVHGGLIGTVAAGNTDDRLKQYGEIAGNPAGGNGDDPAGDPDAKRTKGGRVGRGPVGTHVGNDQPVTVVPQRPSVCVGAGCTGAGPVEVHVPPKKIDEDGPQLTASDIDTVIRANSGLFRACYQKQVDRVGPGLAGKLVMKFKIGSDGKVKEAKAAGGTLNNDDVAQCAANKLYILKFPARGGGATVTYPFVFAIGG